MLKIGLYSQHLNSDNNITSLYLLACSKKNIIYQPKLFCDQIHILSSYPTLHTSYLMGQQLLILTDNSVYQIADIFGSNRFICIDKPSRHSAKNVDFYSIEHFNKKNENEYLEILQTIFFNGKYENYVI